MSEHSTVIYVYFDFKNAVCVELLTSDSTEANNGTLFCFSPTNNSKQLRIARQGCMTGELFLKIKRNLVTVDLQFAMYFR